MTLGTPTLPPAELSDRDVAIWRSATRRLLDAADRFEVRCRHTDIACECADLPVHPELVRARREYDAAIDLIPAWRVVRDAARRVG